jgi:hypothetical protein
MPETKAPLPTLEEALKWRGLPLDGLGNKTLGRIAGIHVDADDGKPRWALIPAGPAGRLHGDPVRAPRRGRRAALGAYDRDWIREAPRFRPNESLTATHELELCGHWGISVGHGRAAELAGGDADKITAVPAED